MKFSIITASLNEKESIEKTLLSVFNQTYKDWELILIDGGSTDGTLEAVEKYKDRIAYFVSEKDDGIYYAMDKGVAKAQGDFLIFLNANDTFYDNDVLKNVAQELTGSKTKILFGDVNYVDENNGSSEIAKYDNAQNDFYTFFFNSNICHQVIFYKRELFGTYDKRWKIYSDWAFNVKNIVKKKVKTVHIPLTIANFATGGFSSNPDNEQTYKEERELLYKEYYGKLLRYIEIHNFLRKYFKSVYRIFGEPFDVYRIVRERLNAKRR